MPAFDEEQIPKGALSNGSEVSKDRCHPDLGSLISSCHPITLKFMDICYCVKLVKKKNRSGSFGGPTYQNTTAEERTILSGLTGMVSPGEILAVIGPSGSGKSTLLNALAGRLSTPSFTGSVLYNDKKLSKPVLRKTGFVTQDDLLYPHLTVRETLVFCSLLRLPNSLSKKEKTLVAESVIIELGLIKCQNTIIGNSFIRGVSGGERKRVSIGHEMLVNPSLLLLDEPTSGLDSTTAYRLVLTLGSLAQKGKTIVTSVHQPSSRVFQMFNSVLVLSEGRAIYFGKGCDAMNYFSSVGFSPSFAMNPADFLLDLANGVCQLDCLSEVDKHNIKQSLISSYNSLLAPKVKAACIDDTTAMTNTTRSLLNKVIPERINKEINRSISSRCRNWYNQFTILLHRSLKERKQDSFNYLRVLQVIASAILAGSIWWQSDFHDVRDRLGLLFFMVIFLGVLPSFNAVFVFPQDRSIFIKERASGMYSLSSYFMARITGDLLMELVLPTIFVIVTYWMAGLKPELGAFLSTLAILLGYVLVAQGMGLALGAAIMDAKQASTLVTVTMLAFIVTGGFYVHKIPACIAWVKYVSFTFYCYGLLINIQYGEGHAVSSLLGCSHYGNNKSNCRFVEGDVEGQIHPSVSIGVLVSMFFSYRLLAYAALKRIKA